uniref:Uncharacterized protein n=1 Tax=Oxyrrhis marina TaxID=2969 RepID=A0A7S4LPF2_OXYMA
MTDDEIREAFKSGQVAPKTVSDEAEDVDALMQQDGDEDLDGDDGSFLQQDPEEEGDADDVGDDDRMRTTWVMMTWRRTMIRSCRRIRLRRMMVRMLGMMIWRPMTMMR